MTTTSGPVTRPPSRTQHHRTIKRELTESPLPDWALTMVNALRPDWSAVLEAPLFTRTAAGEFSDRAWRQVILDFFCVVEAFPKYMGDYLAKTTFGQTPGDYLARDWLIGNIRTEALHAQWYADWAAGHGSGYDELGSHRPCPRWPRCTSTCGRSPTAARSPRRSARSTTRSRARPGSGRGSSCPPSASGTETTPRRCSGSPSTPSTTTPIRARRSSSSRSL